jgi:amidohydrolase
MEAAAMDHAYDEHSSVEALKRSASEAVTALREAILVIGHAVHSNPELAYHEVASAALLVEAARSVDGARVDVGLGTLPTAFIAEAGEGELVITLCAEYDALPGIGHACGHNIIAAAAFGAFAALAPMADVLNLTVRLLGTPAEESAGGKVDLLQQGFFDGSHAVLMVHPTDEAAGPVMIHTRASTAYRVTYQGRAAHAAAQPWAGVNALDAMTVALTSIGLARQQLEPGQQIHGYLTQAGVASNVIPESASGEWMIRADSIDSLTRAFAVFKRCVDAGAVATGATLTLTRIEHPYAAMINDEALSRFFYDNATRMGRAFVMDDGVLGGSSDIANVSTFFPTIQPMIGLGDGAPDIHTAPFAAYAGGPDGDSASVEGALLLALTAIDAAVDPETRSRLISRPAPDTSAAGTELDSVEQDRE